MIAETAIVREMRRSFVTDESLTERATTFLVAALSDWQLDELVEPMSFALAALIRWATGHGSLPEIRCSVTWDTGLVFVELQDRGGLVPEPHVSRVDAELALLLLAPPAIEWGADLDARGRQLWAAFATNRDPVEERGA